MPTTHRHALGVFLGCLLLAVGSVAGTTTMAGADDTPGVASPDLGKLDARDFALLPLNDLERGELALEHPALVRRLTILKERIEKLRARRAERKQPDDAGGRAIAGQIEAARREMTPLLAKVIAACRRKPGTARGLDDRLLAHLAQAPTGPARVARYAMGLVTYVEGMPPTPAQLLANLLPRAQGALLALAAQKERTLQAARQGNLTEAQRAALAASFDAQVRRIERRWWRLVDDVVPRTQRAAIHRALPRAYQQPETIIRHVYDLPDLTASQGVRIRALLEEIQAQAAPDGAAAKRLEREARNPATKGTRKAVIGREIQAAHGRLLELQRDAVETSRRILTPAQWEALEAIPPRVTFQDRRATSVQILAGMPLSAAQQKRLRGMRAELADTRRAYQERRIKTAARAAGIGPDSPMMAGMQMEMANLQAEAGRLQRRFNGRIFLTLLTPEQVTAWVLAPQGDR